MTIERYASCHILQLLMIPNVNINFIIPAALTSLRLHHSEKFVNSKRAVFVDDELQLLENILEQIEALRELGTKSRAHSLLPTKQ